MINVGVVGLGAMGQHHVRVYHELGYAIAGVSDSDAKKTTEMAGKYHVQGYLDYHELIGRVDAVSIAVPTSLHARVACDFLEHGIQIGRASCRERV